jgi:DNA helicase II / ATP-dependent DNA helicase PcrA
VGGSLLDGAAALIAQGGIGGRGAGALRGFLDGIARWHVVAAQRRL